MPSPGSDAKAPLRGLAKLLVNVDPGVRTKIESAFAEAENLLDFHNRSVVERQERRKLSGLVDAPIIAVQASAFGVAATWDRLDDPRITLYEVQLSSNDIFSDPTSFTVVDTNFALEGQEGTVYIRVRGVRPDGTAGPFSNIESVTLGGSPSRVYTAVIADAIQTSGTLVSTSFTRVQQLLETVDNESVEAAITFGSIGVETDTADVNDIVCAMIRINGRPAISYSVNKMIGQPETSGLGGIGRFNVTLLSVLTPGGFSAGFGPAGVETLDASTFLKLLATQNTQGSPGGTGTHTGWTNPEAPQLGTSAALANYQIQFTAGAGSTSARPLHLYDFQPEIPDNDTITGVQVDFTALSTGTTAARTVVVSNIRLRNSSGVAAGTNLASNELVPLTNTLFTYGGPGNLWGNTLTPAEVNDPDFGVVITFFFTVEASSTLDVDVQYVNLTLFTSHNKRILVTIDLSSNFSTNPIDYSLTDATINAIDFVAETVN